MATDQRQDPPTGPEHDHDESQQVAADDRIIGVMLRRSLWLLGAVLLGVLIYRLWPVSNTQMPTSGQAAQAPQAVAPAERSPPRLHFTDVSAEWGIAFTHSSGAYGERLLPETMGSGVAVLDLEADGDMDLLFVNSREWPWRAAAEGSRPATAALFRNDGAGRFTDITRDSGLDIPLYGMGVAVADVDSDGLPDVYLTAVGGNRLLRNLGQGRFEDITTRAGVGGEAQDWSTGAMFFDYDRDGLLDLLVLNYVQWSREIDLGLDYQLTGIGRAYGPPSNYAGTHSRLYRNLGDGRFADVSAPAGLHVSNPATGLPMGKALALTAVDPNEDGWLDVLVANDTVQNFLFHNLGKGRFEERGAETGLAFDNAGAATGAMGVDSAWYANDAAQAIAIGNFANEMTSFFVAQGRDALFTDESIVSGVGPSSRQALTFGVLWLDADLDGAQDLLQTNGHIEPDIHAVQPSQQHAQPAQLYWNCGAACRRPMHELTNSGDLAQPVVGRGLIAADLDGDGDLDVVITQSGGPARVLRNDQGLAHHWLRIRLHGSTGNRDAIGAVVTLQTEHSTQRRLHVLSRSYLSSAEPVLTFGLGSESTYRAIHVRWPDGSTQKLAGGPANQLLQIQQQQP